MLRTYSELLELDTFEERFRYLALGGSVAAETFGADRWLNQDFYRSRDWKQLRFHVIARDRGCDLAVEDYEIHHGLNIHHMNPMTPEDIIEHNDAILDPEFLITTSARTHKAIHYGDARQAPRQWVPRRPGDTVPWR